MTHIVDLSNHSYRTELPNIIFQLGLTDGEFRFYCYIKRIAGDRHACFKSLETMAIELGKTRRGIIKFKKKLSQPFRALHGRPLIKVTPRLYKSTKERNTDLIEIVDIWDLNIEYYAEEARLRRLEKEHIESEKKNSNNSYVVNQGHRGGEQKDTEVVNGEALKEDPIQEDPIKNNSRRHKASSATEKIKVKENVLLTQKQIHTLIQKHGPPAYEQMITKLSEAKKSKGYVYRSDYHAIGAWVENWYANQVSRAAADNKNLEEARKWVQNKISHLEMIGARGNLKLIDSRAVDDVLRKSVSIHKENWKQIVSGWYRGGW